MERAILNQKNIITMWIIANNIFFVVNLACAMKVIEPDKDIGLLDADVFGPSVPLMMNISGEPMLNDDNLIEPLLNYGVKW